MLPRFNELKLLAAAIKHKLGTSDNGGWDCKSHGHFVPPDLISKKVRERNFRFITDCWGCKKRLLFDCAVNDNNELIANCREYNSRTDLLRYFTGINENNYRPMDELHAHQPPHEDDHKVAIERQHLLSCRVCGNAASDVSQLNLCRGHTLEALLHLKFRDRVSVDQLIVEMKKAHRNEGVIPSIIVQNKMISVTRMMLDTLRGQELADYVLALPTIIQKLKTIGKAPLSS